MRIEVTYDYFCHGIVVEIRNNDFHFSINLNEQQLKNFEVEISEILRIIESRK